MSDIQLYQSIAEFARSIGRDVGANDDYAMLRTELLHGEGAIQSPPFRTAYHAFLLIENGSGSYTIDGQTFPLGPGAYYFTNPGHVKSFAMNETVRGYILCFTDRYLQGHFAGELGREFSFLYDQTTPVMQPNKLNFARLLAHCRMLLDVYNQSSPFQPQLFAHQTIALLMLTKELLLDGPGVVSANSRAEEIVADFQRLLNAEVLASRKGGKLSSVTEFAQQLFVHPSYFSQVVKEVSGYSPRQLIEERIFTEAVSLLKSSDYSVAQIAAQLGYDDASNFSRFFKRKAGTTQIGRAHV